MEIDQFRGFYMHMSSLLGSKIVKEMCFAVFLSIVHVRRKTSSLLNW